MHRIGLLVDALSVAKEYHALLRWAERQEDVEVCAVVQAVPRRNDFGFKKLYRLLREIGLHKTLSRIMLSVLVRLESVVARTGEYSEIDISEMVGRQVFV